jgi:hypothetical protein
VQHHVDPELAGLEVEPTDGVGPQHRPDVARQARPHLVEVERVGVGDAVGQEHELDVGVGPSGPPGGERVEAARDVAVAEDEAAQVRPHVLHVEHGQMGGVRHGHAGSLSR